MIYHLFIFFISIIGLFFSNSQAEEQTKVVPRYINIIVDSDLYYPISELANKFSSEKKIILNFKFASDDLYAKLKYDKNINFIITKNTNADKINKIFPVETSELLWRIPFGVCGSKKTIYQISKNEELKTLISSEVNNQIKLLTNKKNTAIIFSDYPNLKHTEQHKSTIDAVKQILSNHNSIGLFATSMCNPSLNLQILDLMDYSVNFFENYTLFVIQNSTNYTNELINLLINYKNNFEILRKYNISK